MPLTKLPDAEAQCAQLAELIRPQLQANTNFMDLQNQLKSLEEKIAYARQFYNDVVQKYNTQTEVVPTNIIAGLFHFEQAPYFQVDEADRQVPQVKF